MSGMLDQYGIVIYKWLARQIKVPKQLTRSAWVATLSVVETLVGMIDSGVASDIGRLKEANLQMAEAESAEKKAEAQKRVAEAAEAANRANLPKRKDAFARLEIERKEAEAAKTWAEAEAIRMDAGTRRLQAMAEANARLLDAVSRLRQEGGEWFLSKENLERLLRLDPPQVEREAVEE